jgi:hypothetical protein
MWYILSGMLISFIWVAYEMYTAPGGEQIPGKGFVKNKEGKKISDLWRKRQ